MLFFRYVLLISIASLALVSCTEKPGTTQQTATNTSAGKTLIQAKCTGCHSLEGKAANNEIPHLAAQLEEYLYASLNAYKEGKRSHAALQDMTKEMSDADMRNISAYFASLAPISNGTTEQVQDIHDKGKATSAKCTSCHGKDGNSTVVGLPSLAGQQAGYFIAAVNAYKDGKRKISSKEKEAAMVGALNQVDIEAMALYFASQTPAPRKAPPFGDATAGEPLSANCGSCHGAQGISKDTSVPSLAGQDAHYLVNSIKAYRDSVRKQEGMHKFLSDIGDKDVENIAAFYSVQKSRPAEETKVSMKQLADKCDRCHGPGMDNPMMITPKISGQNKEYLIKALHAYRDNTRSSSPMHKMSLPYSEAIIEGIASWYASQPAR